MKTPEDEDGEFEVDTKEKNKICIVCHCGVLQGPNFNVNISFLKMMVDVVLGYVTVNIS